jgi:hypothetical protein
MRHALAALPMLLLAVACAEAPAAKQPPPAGPTPALQAYPQPYPGQPYPMQPIHPKGVPPPRPGTLGDAEAELNRAERELEGDLAATAPSELGTSRCQRLCASLASMRRAVESICEMAGEDDDRCKNARARLRNNEQRIADAGCTCQG